MARPETLERRLRIASFLFIVGAILLAAGGFYLAGHQLDQLQGNPAFQQMSAEQVSIQVLSYVYTERIVVRCLFLAMLLVQVGIVFLLYLLVLKTKRLEELV